MRWKELRGEKMEKEYFHRSTIRPGNRVRGYINLYSRDGGRSQVFHDGWSEAVYRPYGKLSGQFEFKALNGSGKLFYLQLCQDIRDAESFVKFTSRGMKSLSKPDKPHVHIFKVNGVVAKVHLNHFPEWKGVLFDVSELTITEIVKEWNYGEKVMDV